MANRLRRVLALFSAGVIALVLTACGSNQAGSSNGSSGTKPTATFDTISKLEAAAKSEGELTWYVSVFGTDQAHEVANQFTKTYGIKVNVLRNTNGPTTQRFQSEEAAGHHTADVITVTDETSYVLFSKKGYLAKYTPLNDSNLLPAYRNLDPHGYYSTAALGTMVMIYNPNKLSLSELPKTWHDLLDPRWKGKISSGSALTSGYVGAWGTYMYQLYGPDFLPKLAKQKLLISASALGPVDPVSTGQSELGITAAFGAREAIQSGSPLKIYVPSPKAVGIASPIAISSHAPHPAAARLFEYYLNTPKFQKLRLSLGYQPITKTSDSRALIPSNKEIHIITLQDVEKDLDKVRSQWRENFGA